MQTWDAIMARRNVRQFTDEPVASVQLERILEAGRRAPSARNWQPWDFVLVTERAQLAKLAMVWRGAAHVAFAAAAVALVARPPADDRESRLLHYDLGQATMLMAVAATDLGLGTGHAAVEDQDLARAVLRLPPDRFCAYLLAIGHPAGGPLRPMRLPDRRPFSDVVHYGQWRDAAGQ